MSENDLDRLVDELRRQRDELRVRVHLLAADAQDEWEELEKRWEHLRARAAVVGREAKEAGQDVLDAVRLVGEELKNGYERLRSLL